MTLEEIMAAVDRGHRVHWSNPAYCVIKDEIGQYLIKFLPNGHCIGLTNQTGTQLNGEPDDFFVAHPQDPVGRSDDDGRLSKHCSICGGDNIKIDAWAHWNAERQRWELGQVFDHAVCDDCAASTHIIDRPWFPEGPDPAKDIAEEERQARAEVAAVETRAYFAEGL